METKVDFASLYREADLAGRKAADALTPTPMVVTDGDVLTGKPVPGARKFYVPEGVCGFAWVTVKPGNCGMARWLKKHKNASAGYYGGMELWIDAYGQSMERKEAYARAFANVLNDAGINAYAGSRMD